MQPPPRPAGRAWQATCEQVFAIHGRICHLCGDDGADTVDHVIPRHHWFEGVDDLPNLRPAHGSKRPGCPGNFGRPCPICQPERAAALEKLRQPVEVGWWS